MLPVSQILFMKLLITQINLPRNTANNGLGNDKKLTKIVTRNFSWTTISKSSILLLEGNSSVVEYLPFFDRLGVRSTATGSTTVMLTTSTSNKIPTSACRPIVVNQKAYHESCGVLLLDTRILNSAVFTMHSKCLKVAFASFGLP